MKSETANAFDVQVEIVRVFDAHLNGGRPVAVLPQDLPTALRAWADEVERRTLLERELEISRPKQVFYDQVICADVLYDRAQVFSLLHRKTGQSFTDRTFLEFLRRHHVAKKANRYANIDKDRFVPCKASECSWFVAEIGPYGVAEWKFRPLALAGIIRLIEQDRMNPPLPPRNALVALGGAV